MVSALIGEDPKSANAFITWTHPVLRRSAVGPHCDAPPVGVILGRTDRSPCAENPYVALERMVQETRFGLAMSRFIGVQPTCSCAGRKWDPLCPGGVAVHLNAPAVIEPAAIA